MMARALCLVVALVASAPAAAQTSVVSVRATADVAEPLFSPRGDKVASFVGRDRIAVWSLPDGKLLETVDLPARPASMLFASRANEMLVALRDGTIQVRAIGTGATLRQMKADTGQSALAMTADGRLIASAADERISLWDASGKLLRTFGHEFGDVVSLAFSPDGTLLASAGLDANVHFWDVSTGQLKASLRDQLVATFALMFTSDGKNLVIGGATGTIEIVDVATASIARRFPAQKHAVLGLTVSRDGRSIAVAHFDVDGMTRPASLTVWDLPSGRILRQSTPPSLAQAIGFGPDGQVWYALVKGPALSVWAVP